MKRWPLNKAYFWEQYPFFRLLLPLVAGIIFYPEKQHSPLFLYSLSGTVLFFLSVYLLTALARQNDTLKAISFITLHIALFCTAWLLCYFHDVRNNQHWFGRTTDTAEAYIVQLKTAPAEKERTWKLEVVVMADLSGGNITPAMGGAYVYTYKYNTPALREGDIIIVPNKWQPINNRGNPFEFDYATYTARNNIFHQQFINGDDIRIHKYATENDLSLIRRIHLWCVTQIEWYIKDRKVSGLLKAMLIGDKETLDNELRDAYAETGIVHIMAISGAHITVFFALTAFLLGWIRHRKYRWIKYIAAIPLIWLYVVVAGAPASAVRAATMFSLLGIGLALQKQPNGINQLLGTAFILLCIDPSWLFAVGFQLSFIAVLSIFIFYRPVHQLLSPTNSVLRALWAAISVSIAAEILVAPLVVYYFHLFPLQFIIANVLAYLFMSVLLIAGLLLIAVSPVYSLASLLGSGITIFAHIFNSIIYRLQQLNFTSFHTLTLTGGQLLLLYLTIILSGVALMRKNKKLILPSLASFTLFLALVCINKWQSLQQHLLIVYNTNKGNYIELVEGTHAKLFVPQDDVNEQTRKYVLNPAHINYHIDSVDYDAALPDMITINEMEVAILNNRPGPESNKADYAVLNYQAKAKDLDLVQEFVQPQLLIIGNNFSRNKAATLEAEAEQLGMNLHNVQNDGAFVLE